MTNYYVNYSIGIRAYQAGPYHSPEEAEEHRRDIAGYVGIKECFVSERRNPLRTLVGESA